MRVKRTGILTKIVLAVLFVYALVSIVRVNDRKAQAAENLDELRRVETELAEKNDDMQYAIEHSTDEDVIRSIARDRGMTDPGEEIYYGSQE